MVLVSAQEKHYCFEGRTNKLCRGRVQGVRTPREMTWGFLIQLVFCEEKKKLCGSLVLK